MVKVVVCDDEPLARARLERMVDALESMHLVGMASNGAELLESVRSLTPDIVLLDIHMPGENGIELAQQLSAVEQPPSIIFCTAYDHYALRAFEVNAVDYLMKPVSEDALKKALTKATRLSHAQIEALKGRASADEASGEITHLTAKVRNGVKVIPISSVLYLAAEHKYVRVVFNGGEALLDDSLKVLQDKLGDRFCRVHRSALVSIDHIAGLKNIDGRIEIELKNSPHTVLVSRRHLSGVRKVIKSLS